MLSYNSELIAVHPKLEDHVKDQILFQPTGSPTIIIIINTVTITQCPLVTVTITQCPLSTNTHRHPHW